MAVEYGLLAAWVGRISVKLHVRD